MKKYAFLTCDDLSGYVLDDELVTDSFSEVFPDDKLDVISWSDPLIDWSQYDFVVVRTTWDYTTRLDEYLNVLSKIEQSGCKLLNPLKTIKWNSRKSYLKEVSEKGHPVLKSIFLEDEDEKSLKEKVSLWSEDKVVLKPVVGAGAGLIEVLSKSELETRTSDLGNWSNWFVQPFAEGVLEGERSLLFFNSEFSHAVIKKPKENDFRVQEEHGGSTELLKISLKELEVANKIIKDFGGDLLYARVDLIPTTEGVKLIELELVEPSLYFRLDLSSAKRFLRALQTKTK